MRKKTCFTYTIKQKQKNERNLNNKNEFHDLITDPELKVNIHSQLPCMEAEL